jgi:hypothetical protein
MAVSPPRDEEEQQQHKLLQQAAKNETAERPHTAVQPDDNDEDYANDEDDEFMPEQRKNNLAVLGRLRPMLQCPAGERLAVPVVVQMQDCNSQRQAGEACIGVWNV